MLTVESLQCEGVFMLLYLVLPSLDVFRALFVFTTVATVPSLLQIFNQPRHKHVTVTLLDVAAFMVQLFALVAWLSLHIVQSRPSSDDEATCAPPDATNTTLLAEAGRVQYRGVASDDLAEAGRVQYRGVASDEPLNDSFNALIMLPVALVLCSLAWWENFVDMHTRLPGGVADSLLRFRHSVKHSKTKLYACVSIVKILLTFLLLVLYYGLEENRTTDLRELFDSQNFYSDRCLEADVAGSPSFLSDWLAVAAIHVCVGVAAFYAADLAVKGHMQTATFTVPLALSTPLTLLLLAWACRACAGVWSLPIDYFFNCAGGHASVATAFAEDFIYVGAAWWVSQLWVARHLWMPRIEKLAKTDK